MSRGRHRKRSTHHAAGITGIAVVTFAAGFLAASLHPTSVVALSGIVFAVIVVLATVYDEWLRSAQDTLDAAQHRANVTYAAEHLILSPGVGRDAEL